MQGHHIPVSLPGARLYPPWPFLLYQGVKTVPGVLGQSDLARRYLTKDEEPHLHMDGVGWGLGHRDPCILRTTLF